MINLLPELAKKELARARFGRFVLVGSLGLLFIVASGAALMFLTLISINLQKGEFIRELETAKKSPTLARVEQVETKIRELNKSLGIFSEGLRRENRIAKILDEVLESRQSSVSIDSIAYNGPGEFSISGKAGTRDDLLEFTRLLSSSAIIANVGSPISNLLKNREIEYVLTFTVPPEVSSEEPVSRP